jgi:hypothetical protein
MTPLIMERWVLQPSPGNCHGCRYLAGVGPFVSHTAPRPPLHDHCNCVIRVIPTGGLGLGARAAMEAQARRNTARVSSILRRASTLVDRPPTTGPVDTIVDA